MDGQTNPNREARIRRALHEYVERTRMVTRQPGLDGATVEAVEALDAAGIDVLLLKGAALARTLYRADEHRGYFDIDLLVAPEDLTTAGAILARLGYANISEMQGIEDVAGILHAQSWSRPAPEDGTLSIDLHWRLPGCEAPAETVWNALNKDRTTIAVGGRSVQTLARPALALHLALHVAQHGPGDLKAMGDLNRGLGRWPREAWAEAAGLARELRGMEAFAAGLRLTPAGVALADELGLPDAEAGLWSIAHSDERPRGTFHMQAFAEAASVRERLGVLRRSLLPTRAWIVWEHPWAAPGGLRLLAGYVAHAVRTPVWAARAWRFRRRQRRQLT